MDYVCFGFGAPLDACGDPVRLAAIGSEISRVRTARNRSAEVYSSRPHLLTNPLSDRPNSFTGSENRLSAEIQSLHKRLVRPSPNRMLARAVDHRARKRQSFCPLAAWPASKKVFGYCPSPQILNEPKSLYQRPSGASGFDSLHALSW